VGCLPYGVIYYITVPSMYMLLIIYSLFNLNNVSWGTRETVVQLTQMQTEVDFLIFYIVLTCAGNFRNDNFMRLEVFYNIYRL
jgi:hypothetical protein